MAKIKLTCDTCGKVFEKYASRVSAHNFCCRDCYLEFHSRKAPMRVCETCGKEFKGKSSAANRFCSRECYLQAHGIKNKIRVCPVCHQEFSAKQSTDKYCGWECYNKDRHPPKGDKHPNWKGGVSIENDKKDSNLYKEWRQQVYKRDNYSCQGCGSKIRINAHYIKGWANHLDLRYEVANGITLCEQCHIAIHKHFGYNNYSEPSKETILTYLATLDKKRG